MDFKDILKKQLNKKGLAKSVQAALVCDALEEWIDKNLPQDLKKDLEVISFRDGVLKVRVASSVISQELKLKHSDILEYIKNKSGEDIVKKIVFV